MKKLALFGNNITNSLSPSIYHQIALKLNLLLSYQLKQVSHVNDIDVTGLDGFNITSPFKNKFFTKTFPISFKPDPVSEETQAPNTYKLEGNKYFIYNTDYYGIKSSFLERKISVRNLKVLILGSGDVSKTLIYFLKKNDTSKIKIFNRSIRKEAYYSVFNINKLNLQNEEFDLLISTIPTDALKNYPLISNYSFHEKIVFDLSYQINDSILMQKEQAQIIDGLSMLIWQAIRNIEIWFDIKIDLKRELKEEIYQKVKP